MDPMQLQSIMQMLRQQQMGGAAPMGAQMQPQGQLPAYGAQQQMGSPQLPSFGQSPQPSGQQGGHHGGFNPLMLLSPMGGMMMSNPGMAMFGLSPALGIARALGAFK